MKAKLYRKKPVVIEAMCYTCLMDAQAIAEWSGGEARLDDDQRRLRVDTREGTIYAELGDYIIRGVTGEHYPCGRDIFWMTYEQASPSMP